VEARAAAEAKARLDGLLHGLEDTIRTLGGSDDPADAGAHDPEEYNPTDIAANLTDAERREAAQAVARGQREEVLAALGRLEDGSYGRCVDCGAPLPEERLLARPEAARCVTDQTRLERAS
jgi:DnaK suppressor protein